jgi:PAS domain S-box-containing protein
MNSSPDYAFAPWDRDDSASLSLIRLIAQSTNDGIWDWNLETDEVYYSPRWLELVGYLPGELSRHIDTFVDLLHPDDRLNVKQALAEYRAGSRREYRVEFRLRHKDGSWRWILTRGIILHDAQGRAIRFAGTHTDITDRVRTAERLEFLVAERTAELRQTEQALRDAVSKLERERDSKLMNIEAIMASIAHEIRQPLAGVAMNGSAARRFLSRVPIDVDEVQACLDRIKSDCARASEVFDSIRALFVRGEQKRQCVNVNEVALEVLQALRGELVERSVTAYTELASDLPLVEAHRSQVQQVIINLVQNAVEAMEETKDRNRVVLLKTEVRYQDAIIVAVEDSGPGLDSKRIDSVFDAFVTTKSHGIGLGLAICRMIVDRHGGELTASSDGQNGARFQFSLPLAPVST